MLRIGWLLCALLFAGLARAQVSGSVTLLSDYRYHGASLSDESPVAQAALAWDRGDGWYAGVQLSQVKFAYPDASRELQALPYLGYVREVRPGLNAEAGVQYSAYSDTSDYDYAEVYAGLGGERLRGRVSYAPEYFGRSTAAWYAELDGSHPFATRWRFFAHAGVLHVGSDAEYAMLNTRQWQGDVAAGLGVAVAGFDVQGSWTTTVGPAMDEYCAPWRCGDRAAWILRLSRSW